MDLSEAMNLALDMEKKGQALYLEVSQKTSNLFVKSTFEYLAAQEENHISEIEDYLSDSELDMEGDTLAETKQFFTMTVDKFKENLELSNDDIEAHKRGMELEQSSYEFYKQRAEESDDEVVKNFFTFLMKQEAAHYEFIEKSYNFLKDPEQFNLEQEDWSFEG